MTGRKRPGDSIWLGRVLVDGALSAAGAGPDLHRPEFSLLFWIADPFNGQLNVRSEINLRVLEEFRTAWIDIPYPQRVVHVKQDLSSRA